MSYELVKLLRPNPKDPKKEIEVKMSGRRGRYVLADDIHKYTCQMSLCTHCVYSELKATIKRIMEKKFAEKGVEEQPEFYQHVIQEIATAAMKYALVSVSPGTKVTPVTE